MGGLSASGAGSVNGNAGKADSIVVFILCTLSAKTMTYYRTLFYRLEKSRLHYIFIIGQ